MEDRELDQARSKPDTVHLLEYCGAGMSRKKGHKMVVYNMFIRCLAVNGWNGGKQKYIVKTTVKRTKYKKKLL